MDGSPLELPIFLVATFAGALVAGLSGFAFGLVAASIWLYILTPLQTASLIIAFGLLVQGYSVWKLRHALDWRKLWPFLVGAAVGVPVGVTLLTWTNPQHAKIGVGALLVLYSLYALFRPAMEPVKSGGVAADACVGFFNGAIGGTTGLAGVLVTIWAARMAQGCPAYRLPARRGRRLRHERSMAWSKGSGNRRDHQTVFDRAARLVRRHVGRHEALRPAERSKLSEGRSHPAARLRGYTDLLRIAGRDPSAASKSTCQCS